MELIFATHNSYKVSEVQAMLPSGLHIASLAEIGCMEEIPETQDTLKGNALQKAQYVVEHYHCNCFADDTGLEIDALDGRPGVYSARYAGEGCSFADNVRKVLAELQEVKELERRSARFRTVVALLLDGKEYFFEGRVDGFITLERSGCEGFGYDPVFLPQGYRQTFAEMPAEEKNRISHRGRAVSRLVDFLSHQL